MYLPSFSLAILSLIAVTAVSISAAQTPIFGNTFEDTCNCTGFNNSGAFVCGDRRFGPTVLPNKFPMLSILSDYDRFAGLTPQDFLQNYWRSKQGEQGQKIGWIYPGTPESRGFQLDADGHPIRSMMELPVNLRVDRFGSECGHYFAAADAPFTQRSLPPDALDMCPYEDEKRCAGDAKEWPFAYHAYEVAKSFNVMGGPVAPGFGQPGLGVQFDLKEKTICQLVEGGFLRRLTLAEIELGPGTKAKCGRPPINCDCKPVTAAVEKTGAREFHNEM